MEEDIIQKLEREEIKLASIKKRAISFIIDDLIISILFLVIYSDNFMQVQDDFMALSNMMRNFILQLILLKICYQTLFIWLYGASLGKIFMKINCIDTTMLSKPDLNQAFIRAIVRIFSETCFYLGFAWAFGNEARQSWHDKIAGTIVCENK